MNSDVFRLSWIVLVVDEDEVAETRSFREPRWVGYRMCEFLGESDNLCVKLDCGFCNSEESARLEGPPPLRLACTAVVMSLLGILASEKYCRQ